MHQKKLIVILLIIIICSSLSCQRYSSDDITPLTNEPSPTLTQSQTESEANSIDVSTTDIQPSYTEDSDGEPIIETETIAAYIPDSTNSSLINDSLVKAQAINPDVCAWIEIPSTPISFPILQHKYNNSYYLRHDINGNYSLDGSIFIENYNSSDFSDYMTVVYGHTMEWGTMFTPLHEYRDRQFFDNNRYIYIYTNDRVLAYKIFAAYEWDTRHLLLSIDFNDRIERSVYLQYIKTLRGLNVIIADDVDVTADDYLLTLSCCTMSGDKRFLVQGVLVDEHS
jgi:sortase B